MAEAATSSHWLADSQVVSSFLDEILFAWISLQPTQPPRLQVLFQSLGFLRERLPSTNDANKIQPLQKYVDKITVVIEEFLSMF